MRHRVKRRRTRCWKTGTRRKKRERGEKELEEEGVRAIEVLGEGFERDVAFVGEELEPALQDLLLLQLQGERGNEAKRGDQVKRGGEVKKGGEVKRGAQRPARVETWVSSARAPGAAQGTSLRQSG